MNTYVVLMRGINVGGKNKISMKELKQYLEDEGFESVVTYINSGNLVLRSSLNAGEIGSKIESILPKKFKLDSKIIRILAIKDTVFKKIVAQAPKGFGTDTANHRYEVLFLMGVTPNQAIKEVAAREGIDEVRQGEHALYYKRPSLTSPNATKSYLGKVTQQPIYKSLTIRNWNTTSKLAEMIKGN